MDAQLEQHVQLDLRRCKVCHEALPCTEDRATGNYFVVKRQNGKIYFSHTCKTCTLDARRQYMKDYHAIKYVKKRNNPIDQHDQVNVLNN